MSRIGKNPVTIPEGVDVAISGREVTVKGKTTSQLTQLAFNSDLSPRDSHIHTLRDRDWIFPNSRH
jgi:large subunit ribosomal protein L6